MAVRNESVRLSLQDDFSTPMAKAAAATALLDRALNDLDGSNVNVARSSGDVGSGVSRMSADVDRSGSVFRSASADINQYSGRLRLILDGIAAVGPALVPIGAVAIPAITGLAAQLGIAAAAAGTAVLAFQGVGEAFDAIEKARLDPTVENVSEMERLMRGLEPAARGFVVQVEKMKPALDSIQDAAANEMLPGFTEGLADLESMIPAVRSAVGDIAAALGDVAIAEADAFDSARGREFLRFVGDEAGPTLSKLFETVRNLAAGMGEMWMAFDPVNDDFADWLLKQAKAFDEWAQRLDQTKGFEEFVAYIRESGPQVADALGAMGNMLLQIVEAAAPMGGPVLAGIEAFSDAVATIADSEAGSTLVAAAAAAAVLNRTLQMTAGLMTRVTTASGALTAGGLFASTKGNAAKSAAGFAAVGGAAKRAQTSVAGFRADLAAMRGEYSRMGAAGAVATSALSNTSGAAQRARGSVASFAATAGKAGLTVGALAAVSTEAGQGLGVSNTAMLGLVGTMAGPWGAAAGAAVGGMLDLSSASRDGSQAQQELASSMERSGSNLVALQASLEQGRAAVENYSDDLTLMQKVWQGGDFLFTGETAADSLVAAFADARREVRDTNDAFTTLGVSMGEFDSHDGLGRNIIPSLQDLSEFAQRAEPLMADLGVTVEDLANMDAAGVENVARQIGEMQAKADSGAGRMASFGDAVKALGIDAQSTASSAEQLGSSLEALLGPTLNAEQATDQWRQSLQEIRSELNSGVGFEGFGQKVMENRQITRDYANDVIDRLTAMAKVSTTTEADMARAVRASRSAFIESGIAAGISRKAIVARADAMGLTPKLVKTTFEAAGIDRTILQVREARRNIEALPKKAQTEIRAEGIPRTMGQIDALVKKYDLTEKERRALITLRDLASKGIDIVDGKLKKVDGKRAIPTADLNSGPFDGKNARTMGSLNTLNAYTATPTATLQDNASGVAGFIQSRIAAIQSKTVTITAYYRSVGAIKPPGEREDGGLEVNGVRQFASGGFGSNGRYYAREPQIVPGGADILWGEKSTGWEAYISGKPSERSRNIDILSAAADRLGVAVSQTPQRAQPAVPMRGGSDRVATSAAPSLKGLLIAGAVDIPGFGEARIRGIVRDEMGEQADFDMFLEA